MKVYISSTYQDLIEHRAAVDRTLRRMGHDVIGMEQYVAEGSKPAERCRADVRAADAYVIIVAWRFGTAPGHAASPPDLRSITEIEFEEAKANGKPVLAFLLDPEAPWPPSRVDGPCPGRARTWRACGRRSGQSTSPASSAPRMIWRARSPRRCRHRA
jgi:hypothetical protein